MRTRMTAESTHVCKAGFNACSRGAPGHRPRRIVLSRPHSASVHTLVRRRKRSSEWTRRRLTVSSQGEAHNGQPISDDVSRAREAVSLTTLQRKFKNGEPLSMITAYDYPSAVLIEESEIDIVLVGDSAAMLVHGHDATTTITVDEMLSHCKAVTKGASRPLIIGDLPFGSYEVSEEQTIATAVRFVKEAKVDAVKLEGGTSSRIERIRRLKESGISVMGHIGLTLQSPGALESVATRKYPAEIMFELIQQAIALEEAGCFSMLLEFVPENVGAALQNAVDIPVISIGAGAACGGQVMLFHDIIDWNASPSLLKLTAPIKKTYGNAREVMRAALADFNREVKDRSFPEKQHCPYQMDEEETKKLNNLLKQTALNQARL